MQNNKVGAGLGLAIVPHSGYRVDAGWHLTTLYGFLAAAGVAGRLLGLDEKGITGARNCLEGRYGLFNQYHQGSYDPEALTAGLGEHYEGVNVSVKPYPCGRGTHTAIDAALAVVNTHRIEAGEVKEVAIYTGEGCYSVLSMPLEVKSRPRNAVDTQFSVPWSVAVAVAQGRVTMADFTAEAIKRREKMNKGFI